MNHKDGDDRVYKAIKYHERSLTNTKEIGDRAGEGRAYGNLSNAYQSLGDYQKAIDYDEKCLKIAKEIGTISSFVELTPCSFLYLFMVRRNESQRRRFDKCKRNR